MPFQGPGMCKGCEQYSRSLLSGYCPPCHEFMREAHEEIPDDREAWLDELVRRKDLEA